MRTLYKFYQILIDILSFMTASVNPKVETPKAWVWISLPELPTYLFAMRFLLSIATVAGKPIAVDKDNLPLFCTHCKHQGHEENKCRLLMRKTMFQGDRLGDEGDALDFLNDKRVGQKDIEKLVDDQNIGQQLAEKVNSNKDNSLVIFAGVIGGNQIAKPTEIRTSELNVSVVAITDNQILVPSREMVQHQMDVSGGCNNQQSVAIDSIVDHVGVKEYNSETIAKALVTASQGDSAQQLNGNDIGNQSVTDVRINIEITATSKPIDLQAKNSNREENASENWTVIAHKKSVGSRIGSSTKKGMSSLSHAKSTNDLIISKEKQEEISVSSKLTPEDSIFVPRSVIAKKNESGALASGISQCINLGEEFFEEDDEDNILDICFDKVAWDENLSPKQQRSGSNKNKKKTHRGQHS
ncbi:hypothetical protein H5410_001307 [Solanum commersonii]|uniref:DUF4283 domain-containing protein n=1 Tax=Solanum commersonii TaxID=4109 RepID=A0A9J6AYJ5_SOLCO|nr:hypothetical protein H5410_001307 [Solanum commersonii]